MEYKIVVTKDEEEDFFFQNKKPYSLGTEQL